MGWDSFTLTHYNPDFFKTHCWVIHFNCLSMFVFKPHFTTRRQPDFLLTKLTSGPPELPYCKKNIEFLILNSVFVGGFTKVLWYMCLHVDLRWWLRLSGCSPCLSCGDPAPCPPSGWCWQYPWWRCSAGRTGYQWQPQTRQGAGPPSVRAAALAA